MDVKKFLYQVRNGIREVKLLQEQLEQLNKELLPSAIRYDVDCIQTSPIGTKIPDVLAETIELERKIKDCIIRQKRNYTKALQMINSLDDTIQRQVLSMYFINSKRYRFEQIGNELGYSKRQIIRKYSEAIEILSRKEK